MKRVFTPALSILMVIAILVNTAGITVYNHFCTEEGETTLSLTSSDNCCENKHEKVSVEVKHACCSEKKESLSNKKEDKGCCSKDAFTAQWKLESFSVKKNILLTAPIISVPVITPEFKWMVQSMDSFMAVNTSQLQIPPADILHLHAVLII